MRIGREIDTDWGKVMELYFLKGWNGEERRNKGRKNVFFLQLSFQAFIYLHFFNRKLFFSYFCFSLFDLLFGIDFTHSMSTNILGTGDNRHTYHRIVSAPVKYQLKLMALITTKTQTLLIESTMYFY